MVKPGVQDRIARTAVEKSIDGVTLRWRTDQTGAGERHDFDVDLPGERCAALEATWSRDKDLAEQEKALSKHGWRVDADGLASSWWLSLEPDAHVWTLHQQVEDFLANLEREGVEDFNFNTPQRVVPVGPLRGLGVESGMAVETSGGNAVYFSHGPGGGRVAGAVAAEAAEREAHESGNREKLVEAGRDERHLFVVMHPGEGARTVMNLRPPPDARPNLPPEITHLWAAAKVFNEDRYVIWRGSQEDAWAQLEEVAFPGPHAPRQ